MSFSNNFILADMYDVNDYDRKVQYLYPKSINKEPIFQENLSKSYGIFKEIIKETELLEGHKATLPHLKFDSQKEKCNKLIEDGQRKIDELYKKLNEGISPYKWKIIKDVHEKSNGMEINCDYLLNLVEEYSI